MGLKKKYSNIEIDNVIKKVDGAMAQEGMPLTKNEKKVIKDCLSGKTTFEKERKKIISECRKLYG